MTDRGESRRGNNPEKLGKSRRRRKSRWKTDKFLGGEKGHTSGKGENFEIVFFLVAKKTPWTPKGLTPELESRHWGLRRRGKTGTATRVLTIGSNWIIKAYTT